MEPTTYGFVGVGRMGALMSARLLEAGHKVVAYDVSREAMDAAKKAGAQLAGSPAEVCNLAEVVYLSLPNPEIVRQASLGPGGVIEGKKVRRVVDFSTIGPRMASAVATGLAEKNITYVDAPVSGGLKGARMGTLAVMVACPKPVYEELEAILKTFGKPFHLGEKAGQAQVMKLANNLLAAAAIALSSEAMVMGVKPGSIPR